jgi:hypothetical protein
LGEEKLTKDIDITLLKDFGNEETLIRKLVERFPSRLENPEENQHAKVMRENFTKCLIDLRRSRLTSQTSAKLRFNH